MTEGPHTSNLKKSGGKNPANSVNTLLTPVNAALDVVRDLNAQIQAMNDPQVQSAAEPIQGGYILPFVNLNEAQAAQRALRLFLQDGEEIKLIEPSPDDTSKYQSYMEVPKGLADKIRDRFTDIDAKISSIRSKHRQSHKLGKEAYAELEKELIRDGLISPIMPESLERLRQAYQLSVPTDKLSEDDFMQRIEEITRQGSGAIVSANKSESKFVGIVMTVMNEVLEAQGLLLGTIEDREHQDGSVTQSIDRIPLHFCDILGLMISRQNDQKYLSRLMGEAWVDPNPRIPAGMEPIEPLAEKYGSLAGKADYFRS